MILCPRLPSSGSSHYNVSMQNTVEQLVLTKFQGFHGCVENHPRTNCSLAACHLANHPCLKIFYLIKILKSLKLYP